MSESLEQRALREWLDSQEFYELCQSYRHATDYPPEGMQTAGEAFVELQREILAHARRLTAEQGVPVAEVIEREDFVGNSGGTAMIREVDWIGEPPTVGTKLYASPPSDALEAKQNYWLGYKAGLHVARKLAWDNMSHGDVNYKVIDAIDAAMEDRHE